MKKIFFILILIPISCLSQIISFGFDKNVTKERAAVRELFWGKNDKFKNIIAVPEKWKNESAVVIYKNEYYDFDKFAVAVSFVSSSRKRIKLLDAAVVKEFSEFSFKSEVVTSNSISIGTSPTYIGFKIIKPSGKEIEIDTDKEVKTVDHKSKLAISNLEVGDIIDYYIYEANGFYSKEAYGFDPVETTLGGTYPIMDYKLEFSTENDFFVNFNTYNGAPELKEVVAEKKGKRKYELSAKDIDKNEFPRWFYPLVELPCYKFQVFFARSGKYEDRAQAFLPEKENIVKKIVSKEDIFNFYEDRIKPDGEISLEKKFLKDKNYESDEEKVREIYYFARHQYYTRLQQAFVIRDEKIFDPFYLNLYKSDEFINSEIQFVKYFMQFLKKVEIDYDVIIATNRENGSIDDLLIQKNVTLLLRINTKKPIYVQFFSPFSSVDMFDAELENTKAYVLQIAKGKKVTDAETITLPSTTASQNNSSIISTIKFNDDLKSLNIDRTSSFIGHFKKSEQKDKLEFYDYINEDYLKYGTETAIDLVQSKRDRAKYTKQYDALILGYKEKQKESLKKSLSDDFDIEVDDHKFEIKSNGRFGSNSPFVYNESFVVKNNLVKKAGENLILEIGKLLTSQIEIDKKEKERKNNVYLTFPRSFDNEIVFEIPSGYSVSGIEKLNKKIENETGSFTSFAKITGNKLIIKTKKQYNNYFEPNKNWSKIIDFLDGAYQFTQEKILLKKN